MLDRARTLVYLGAVDDQYGFGYSLDTPRTKLLFGGCLPLTLAVTESIHTRKEIFHSGHPTDIQHH